jgi:hypothetical protein
VALVLKAFSLTYHHDKAGYSAAIVRKLFASFYFASPSLGNVVGGHTRRLDMLPRMGFVGGAVSAITLHRTLRRLAAKISRLLERPREACQVNHLQAIIGPNAPHNSVDVVLYGLLGKT